MKHQKIILLLLSALLALSLFAGCAKTNPAVTPSATDAVVTDAPSAAPTETASTVVSVTDMTGRAITLDAPATRVVATVASDCEILYALGAGDTLVGRGEYCDYPPEVLDVVSVQTGYETNIEQIVALDPQVVIMNTMSQTVEQVEALEQAGIAVVATTATDIAGVYTSIELIGAVVGKATEAASLVSGMKATFDELSANAGDGTKTIYFEVSPLEWGLWAAGSGTFMNEIAEMIGVTNIFADVEGWAEVSEEDVIARNPDYIVTISMYYGEGPTPTEEIMSRTGWDGITAVRNSAILNLQNNELSRPSPRLAEGARTLFDFIFGSSDD